MSEHHEMSPSNYNAWSVCVHYRSDGRQTQKASEGTSHHEELSRLIKSGGDSESDIAEWAYAYLESQAGDMPIESECRYTGECGKVAGIFGTADAVWTDADGVVNIADLKSFSDGTRDYFPQLRGYAALMMRNTTDPFDPVRLHILDGMSKTVRVIDTDFLSCLSETEAIVTNVTTAVSNPSINHNCQYCKNKDNCKAMNNAIETVSGNNVTFSELSLAKKLVVCDTIEKVIKALKDDARAVAEANGGVIEDGDIRYEIKERAGKGKIKNLCDIAVSINFPSIKTKDGTVKANGVDNDILLSLCDISKTALSTALKDANVERKDIKKKDIDAFVSSLYEKGEPTKYLSRVS